MKEERDSAQHKERSRRVQYFLIAFVILIVEVLVATAFNQIKFIRGSASDFLVVTFLYFAMQGIHAFDPFRLSAGVFLFAVVVEGSQYVHLADLLHLQKGGLLHILLGNTFSLQDILMYLLGCLASVGVDLWFWNRRSDVRP